jgi:prefoldin subunit 5
MKQHNFASGVLRNEILQDEVEKLKYAREALHSAISSINKEILHLQNLNEEKGESNEK